MSKDRKIIILLSIIIIAGIAYTGVNYYLTHKQVESLVASEEVCGQGEGCEISDDRVQGFNVGDQVPNLELTDFNGETTNLYDMLEGKDKFVLSLAVDWCSDCQRQDRKLNEYYSDLPDNYGAAVLFVDYTSKDGTKTTDFNQTKTFIEDEAYSFPTFWDENNVIANDFGGVLATPTNIVLDENAIIKAKTEEIDMDNLFASNQEEYNSENIQEQK